MLKRLNSNDTIENAQVKIKDADIGNLYETGLEFNAPARGKWNIVHTGLLIPESHQVFVCAQGCLRGVIQTTAEMNAMDRMSWVTLGENDMFDGSMESDIVDGTAQILNRMDKLPRAVLVFISCMHLFAGCDFKYAIKELSRIFPTVDFIDCYMHPTMRKSGLTPDQAMLKQLYAPLKPTETKRKAVNMIGNERPTSESSELYSLIKSAGYDVCDITLFKSYDEYLRMAESELNICYLPVALASVNALKIRVGIDYCYAPLCYGYDEIESGYRKIADMLGAEAPDYSDCKRKADDALKSAFNVIGDNPIEIDYTATPRPLGLARLLIEHGFTVGKVYIDCISDEEKADFEWLRSNAPDLILSATVQVKMRFVNHAEHGTEPLAIGQKAAYFSGTKHFVNVVSGGGNYGFDGIVKLAESMVDAFTNEKDTQTVIQYKGIGCESCL